MAYVVSVSRSPEHTFSKNLEDEILLIEGMGVEGDAHCGRTVKHRSRVRIDPNHPNLRQVHLMHSELFAELEKMGFNVLPGDMGENIATSGVDLLSLPSGTKLRFGGGAIVELTGLRNPCSQIDDFRDGLMNAVLDRDSKGGKVRKMDQIEVILPEGERNPLETV